MATENGPDCPDAAAEWATLDECGILCIGSLVGEGAPLPNPPEHIVTAGFVGGEKSNRKALEGDCLRSDLPLEVEQLCVHVKRAVQLGSDVTENLVVQGVVAECRCRSPLRAPRPESPQQHSVCHSQRT